MLFKKPRFFTLVRSWYVAATVIRLLFCMFAFLTLLQHAKVQVLHDQLIRLQHKPTDAVLTWFHLTP